MHCEIAASALQLLFLATVTAVHIRQPVTMSVAKGTPASIFIIH